MSSENSPIDAGTINDLRDLMEDDFDELVESYLEDAEKLIERLRTGVTATDAGEIEHAAHALKSSSANMGAMALSEHAKELERLGREGTVEGASPLVDRAAEEFRRVHEALSAELQH